MKERINILIEDIKEFEKYGFGVNLKSQPKPKTKGDKVRAIFKEFEYKGYTKQEINEALGKMNY